MSDDLLCQHRMVSLYLPFLTHTDEQRGGEVYHHQPHDLLGCTSAETRQPHEVMCGLLYSVSKSVSAL